MALQQVLFCSAGHNGLCICIDKAVLQIYPLPIKVANSINNVSENYCRRQILSGNVDQKDIAETSKEWLFSM